MLVGCESDTWRPLTIKQRADRRLDFTVHIDRIEATVQEFQEFLQNPQPPLKENQRMNWRDLRQLLHSWREETDKQTDTDFRLTLQRITEQGTPMSIKPVHGDEFAIQVLYFQDDTFVIMDRIEERHLLFRCVLKNRLIVAGGTRHPWTPTITGPGTSKQRSIRVFAFWGYDSLDHSTQMSPSQMADCLKSFSNKSHPLRKRIGKNELLRIQQTHDFFFQIND